MELTAKQQEWLGHVEASETFDGTAADYAREQGLDIGQLYFYRSTIAAKRSKPSAFVAATPVTADAGVHVQLPNGVRLRLSDLSEPRLLERLAAL